MSRSYQTRKSFDRYNWSIQLQYLSKHLLAKYHNVIKIPFSGVNSENIDVTADVSDPPFNLG